jgi:hypothetical protein
MKRATQRPGAATRGVAVGILPIKSVTDNHTAQPPTVTPSPEAAGPTGRHRLVEAVPLRDRLVWDLRDISALTTFSPRLLQRQIAAGKMPGPDVRVGRRACWKPATITNWLDSFAQQADGRSVRP